MRIRAEALRDRHSVETNVHNRRLVDSPRLVPLDLVSSADDRLLQA